MSDRRLMTAAALAALSLLSPLAWGENPLSLDAAPPEAGVRPVNLVAGPGTASSRRPIMALLGQTPIGRALDDYGVEIYGHVEAGGKEKLYPPAKRAKAVLVFRFPGQKVLFGQF